MVSKVQHFHVQKNIVHGWSVLLSNTESQPESITFVHPIEAEFARILDYYGIEWEYEPHTFALTKDDDGKITEAFSPDFYLPQQELYVELTTMRPKLITKKNRKIRRLQELYPHINVKLFKRSDLRDMMIKYGIDEQAESLLGTEAQTNGS
jgi:hypoxanthine phosphoribosyltransferase